MISALANHKADNYVNVIIFMTDGEAHIGHDSISRANTSSSRIFVFGVGDNVNKSALLKIAEDNSGKAVFSTSSSQAHVTSLQRIALEC